TTIAPSTDYSATAVENTSPTIITTSSNNPQQQVHEPYQQQHQHQLLGDAFAAILTVTQDVPASFKSILQQQQISQFESQPLPTSTPTQILTQTQTAIQQRQQQQQQQQTCLPSEMLQWNDRNIMSVLKNCLGKELSKVTMPVTLNEPLSFLQRICEYMEYAEILNKANKEEDPADRMKLVATFAVSALASNWERVGKPFNPLLGETYELRRNDFKILCEQVSHHPPISAFHAESSDYKFYGSINPKIKFMGKSINIQPKGVVTVELT
ncbi:PREDICTED: oxysterol-binding protein-related protein 2-like, partial [Bactrocera latifrons]|uniref:oxysterol-binding protein-related protein 2-like n=1 Tax=Bactrocera latifrons TaxID=174628 RepID=UPI0008DC6F37